MNFAKLHGTGNDFVLVDARSLDWSALARAMCDRHVGVGADGLILAAASSKAPVRMRIFNADGSEAEMSGNGMRCLAKFAVDGGIVADGGRVLGHYHVHLNHSREEEFNRNYFAEKTVEGQIEASCALLASQIPGQLKENRDALVRDFRFKTERLEKTAKKMKKRMLGFLKKVSLENYDGPIDEIDEPLPQR